MTAQKKPTTTAQPAVAKPAVAAPVAIAKTTAAPKAAAPVVAAPKTVAPKPAPVLKTAPAAKTAPASKPVAASKPVSAPKADTAKAAATGDLMKPFEAFQEQVRNTTEKSLTEIRSQYSNLKGKADAATDHLEVSLQAAQAGARSFGMKMFDLFREQANANLAHVQSLMGAKSLEDAVKLQQSFVTGQIAALQTQSKEFATFAQKVASDVAEPAKASIVVAFKR